MTKSPTPDTTYMRFRVLTDHDAQMLQIGDAVEMPDRPGETRVVTDIKRKRGGEGRSVTLDNGYTFDPYNVGLNDERYRHMTIWRPLSKFRASASGNAPAAEKKQ